MEKVTSTLRERFPTTRHGMCLSPRSYSRSIVRIILQKTGQAVEVGAGLNEADYGHQRLGIDQRVEWYVRQVELSGARDQHAVEVIFHQRAIGADAELAAEDHIEGVGQGAAGLVAKLQTGQPLVLARPLFVLGLDRLDHGTGQIGLGERKMSMLVELDAFEVTGGKELAQALGDHDHAELLTLGFAAQH